MVWVPGGREVSNTDSVVRSDENPVLGNVFKVDVIPVLLYCVDVLLQISFRFLLSDCALENGIPSFRTFWKQ